MASCKIDMCTIQVSKPVSKIDHFQVKGVFVPFSKYRWKLMNTWFDLLNNEQTTWTTNVSHFLVEQRNLWNSVNICWPNLLHDCMSVYIGQITSIQNMYWSVVTKVSGIQRKRRTEKRIELNVPSWTRREITRPLPTTYLFSYSDFFVLEGV